MFTTVLASATFYLDNFHISYSNYPKIYRNDLKCLNIASLKNYDES